MVLHLGYLGAKRINKLKKRRKTQTYAWADLKNKLKIYLLNIAKIRLKIAPITTTHPAIVVIIAGIPGTDKVPLIIPEPTARDTNIPTIQVIRPINELSPLIFHSPPFIYSPRNKM